jgi:hypothetical protein
MSKIEVGQAYVGEDGQWYFYTENDLVKTEREAYDLGGKDVYYGRSSNTKYCLTKEQKAAYWNGYAAEPYGRKDYGYDEE